jgi:hypothetical protein
VDWQKDVLVPIFVNVVGVFVGVILALWTNQRSQQLAEAQEAKRLSAEFRDLRQAVVSSVVRDTVEARRLKSTLASGTDPYVLGIYLELAVWEAAQAQFFRYAPLDDRIILSRFFDQVRRLARLLDFYRTTLVDQGLSQETDIGNISAGIALYIAEAADDLQLDGIVIVSDHGDESQKRILGLRQE